MDGLDGTIRTQPVTSAPPPSLLVLIIDTNPLSWISLDTSLTLSSVLRALLVFINAHLALNHENRVAVLASHTNTVSWLYPRSQSSSDTEVVNGHTDSVNGVMPSTKYQPFSIVEEQILRNLDELLAGTSLNDEFSNNPPLLSGALSIALSYTNIQTMLSSPMAGEGGALDAGAPGAANLDAHTSAARSSAANQQLVTRILIVSVSDADLSTQYIGLMNSVFAAQRLQVPLDILRLGERTAFLQQASDATSGVFINYNPSSGNATNGHTTSEETSNMAAAGLLQTLMMAYLPDTTARRSLIMPGSAEVDFRAACFCHGKIVDLGGVCSICLSIFCLPLETEYCPTCSSQLRIPKSVTTKPAVVARKKKKKRKIGEGGRDSAAGTPVPGSTPAAADTPS